MEIFNPTAAFLESSLCSMGSCLIRRAKLQEIGGFDESLTKGDDTELYWRLARVARFGFAPWAVFNYRRRSGSQSADGELLSAWEPNVLRRMLEDLTWSVYRPQILARLVHTHHAAIIHHRRRRDRTSALKSVVQALQCDFADRKAWRQLVAVLTIG